MTKIDLKFVQRTKVETKNGGFYEDRTSFFFPFPTFFPLFFSFLQETNARRKALKLCVTVLIHHYHSRVYHPRASID